jgi:hypothetical protein
MAEALTWILLVFAAGFIGYFGRYFGKIVVSRFQKDRGPDGKDERPVFREGAGEERPPDGEKLLKKREKDRLKGEKKLSKKASGEEAQ